MMTSDESYEILGFDSAIFGFPVARVPAIDKPGTLSTAIDSARRSGVRLVYLQTESEDVARVALALDGVPLSKRVTFARDLTAQDVDTFSSTDGSILVQRWTGNTPTHELLELARDAGRFSRFRVDSRVPAGVFERIYEAWIANSVSGEIAEEVLVTRDVSSLTGLVTLGSKDGRAEIGLLAVREKARGHGVGRRLVQTALEWAVRRRFRKAQVITQQDNTAACRLYQSCGYAIERVENVFHFWL